MSGRLDSPLIFNFGLNNPFYCEYIPNIHMNLTKTSILIKLGHLWKTTNEIMLILCVLLITFLYSIVILTI